MDTEGKKREDEKEKNEGKNRGDMKGGRKTWKEEGKPEIERWMAEKQGKKDETKGRKRR